MINDKFCLEVTQSPLLWISGISDGRLCQLLFAFCSLSALKGSSHFGTWKISADPKGCNAWAGPLQQLITAINTLPVLLMLMVAVLLLLFLLLLVLLKDYVTVLRYCSCG